MNNNKIFQNYNIYNFTLKSTWRIKLNKIKTAHLNINEFLGIYDEYEHLKIL